MLFCGKCLSAATKLLSALSSLQSQHASQTDDQMERARALWASIQSEHIDPANPVHQHAKWQAQMACAGMGYALPGHECQAKRSAWVRCMCLCYIRATMVCEICLDAAESCIPPTTRSNPRTLALFRDVESFKFPVNRGSQGHSDQRVLRRALERFPLAEEEQLDPAWVCATMGNHTPAHDCRTKDSSDTFCMCRCHYHLVCWPCRSFVSSLEPVPLCINLGGKTCEHHCDEANVAASTCLCACQVNNKDNQGSWRTVCNSCVSAMREIDSDWLCAYLGDNIPHDNCESRNDPDDVCQCLCQRKDLVFCQSCMDSASLASTLARTTEFPAAWHCLNTADANPLSHHCEPGQKSVCLCRAKHTN